MQGFEMLKAFYIEMEGSDDEEGLELLSEAPFLSMTISDAEIILVFDDVEPDHLCIKAPIGQIYLEHPKLASILTVLLEANFEFSGTRGATIGMNSNSGEVCFFYQLSCREVSQQALQQLLVEFAEVVNLWKETLMQLTQGAS